MTGVRKVYTASAVVFGILHGNLGKAMSRSGYAKRKDDSQRSFDGVNLILSGDWWQLLPVMKSVSTVLQTRFTDEKKLVLGYLVKTFQSVAT